MKQIGAAMGIAAALAAAPAAAQHQQAFKPWIHTATTAGELESSGAVALARTELTRRLVGIGASCEATKPIVTVWLERARGGYTDRLEVKAPDGTVSTFESAEETNRRDERFVTRLMTRENAQQFLDAALQPGAEITNGRWGFISALTAEAAAALTNEVHRCGRRPRPARPRPAGDEQYR